MISEKTFYDFYQILKNGRWYNLSIWDERYVDEEFGLETQASFKYFQEYLKQDFPRSIKALCEKINSQQISQGKSQTKLDTFYKYSQKWKWKKREALYDEHLKNLHFQTKEKEIMDWESEQLKLAKQRSNFHNDTLQKIHKADEEEFPLNKKVYAESQNQEAYNKSIDGIYKILHGGVEKHENKNNNTGELELNQNVKIESEEEKLERYANYFKQIKEDIGDSTSEELNK